MKLEGKLKRDAFVLLQYRKSLKA